jgi:hypothetical protein
MITPTAQQKKYYAKERTIAELTINVPPTVDWIGKIVVFPNGDEVTCDGTQWQPVGTPLSGGTAVLDASSPITGNPTDLDTPAEIAAAIQSLQAFRIANDTDNNLLVDTAERIDGGYV